MSTEMTRSEGEKKKKSNQKQRWHENNGQKKHDKYTNNMTILLFTQNTLDLLCLIELMAHALADCYQIVIPQFYLLVHVFI